MNENEIMNKQIEEIKESVINKVRDLFGKAKDDLQITKVRHFNSKRCTRYS